jgi:hypothetical protein
MSIRENSMEDLHHNSSQSILYFHHKGDNIGENVETNSRSRFVDCILSIIAEAFPQSYYSILPFLCGGPSGMGWNMAMLTNVLF